MHFKIAATWSSKQPLRARERATGVILMCWQWHKKARSFTSLCGHGNKQITNPTALCCNVSSFPLYLPVASRKRLLFKTKLRQNNITVLATFSSEHYLGFVTARLLLCEINKIWTYKFIIRHCCLHLRIHFYAFILYIKLITAEDDPIFENMVIVSYLLMKKNNCWFLILSHISSERSSKSWISDWR